MMRWVMFFLSMAVIALLVSRGSFSSGAFLDSGWRGGAERMPAGSLHILALGTSLTARGSWPLELQTALQASRPGSRVEVLAKPGAASDWGERALANRLAAGDVPDLLLIEFTANDASLAHGMALWTSKARHQRMIAVARDAGMVPVLMVMAPAFGRERLERPGLGAYQQQYRDFTDVALVDGMARWRDMPRAEARALIPDGAHPLPKGWRLTLLPLLGALLDQP